MSIVNSAGWSLEAFKAGAFGLVISVGSEEFPVSCDDGRLYDIDELRDLLLRKFLDLIIAFNILGRNNFYDCDREYMA